MKKKDVIRYFGSAAKTARALRISRGAVSLWPEVLSDAQAYKVELATKGDLKTDETIRLLNLLGDK
jgi:transcriptional repressor of cell division inhibition gene dicB